MIKILLFALSFLTIISFLIFYSADYSFQIPQTTSFNIESKKNNLPSKASPSPYPLTLDKIFDGRTEEAVNLIKIIATGDVIPARSVNLQTIQRNNFLWPFEKTADVLKSADITFINLETPLMQNCQPTNEGMSFCGSSKHIEGLLSAGVDVTSLGNNHTANHGKQGLEETKKLLEDNGILVTGLTGPVFKDIPPYAIKEVNGIKFAFLGYTDISKTSLVSSAEESKIVSEITEATKNSDVVIVQYHWGSEYLTEPEERQKFLARLAIDSGADLIIGNHSHWIKPVEFYKNKLITYGHGNFIFDQEWSQKTKEGIVGVYTFDGKNLIDVEFLPVEIINYGQPYFLEGDKKQKILNELYNESLKLN